MIKFNKDYYDKLPSLICEMLDKYIEKFGSKEWFPEAWEKYRKYVFRTPTDKLRAPGYIFKDYVNNKNLKHYGVKGQRWGVRRFQDEIPDSNKKEKRKNNLKIAGIVLGSVAIGASAVGAAWYLKNRQNLKIQNQKKINRINKAKATRSARKASGYYETYKNVNVLITKGSDFSKQFMNVKVAKILPR